MGERLKEGDALLAPSRYYAEFMRDRLGWMPGAIEVAHNGIALEGYSPAGPPPGPPAIGYLARMTRDKGVEALVDAFIVLARDLGDAVTRLKIGGAFTAGDERFVNEVKRRLAGLGLADRVEWRPNLSREEKVAFLRSLTLFSVPATYAEAFGLYVIEAMACGVPVVQPASAAFPEILGLGGGGECVPPRDAPALARAWQRLLADPARREKMGREGRLSVEKHFSARTMAAQFSQVTDRLARAPA
jgi:glycosyltransferase involved in cell wall biosynthesis